MSDLWFTTSPELELLAFSSLDMFGDAGGSTRSWCSHVGIRERIDLTPTRERIDLERWIVVVPERIRETVAAIAVKTFESTVAGQRSHPSILDVYAAELCAALWRHYNRRPLV